MNEPIEDVQRRRPVWQALSDLFLDADLDDHDFRYMARVLAESGYDDNELQSILHREVFPVCIGSLLSLTGEWTGFSLEWLERNILANVGRNLQPSPLFGGTSSLTLIEPDWRKLLELLPEARHISGNPFRPYPAPAQWPSTVVQLAEAVYYGEDSRFALHDALLEAGHPELADHFGQSPEHPKCCWVLTMILGTQP